MLKIVLGDLYHGFYFDNSGDLFVTAYIGKTRISADVWCNEGEDVWDDRPLPQNWVTQ